MLTVGIPQAIGYEEWAHVSPLKCVFYIFYEIVFA